MAPPPRTRKDSPIFRLLDAGQRIYSAEKDAIAAAQETVEAHLAGRCVTCGDPVAEEGAKLCPQCSTDVAQAGAELGARVVAPVLESAIRELFGGKKLPPAR